MSKETEATVQDGSQPGGHASEPPPPPAMAAIDAMIADAASTMDAPRSVQPSSSGEAAGNAESPAPGDASVSPPSAHDEMRASQPSAHDDVRASQPSDSGLEGADQRAGAAVLPDAGAARRARTRMTLRIPDDSVPVTRTPSTPDLSSSIRMPSSPDLSQAADPASVIRAMRIISVGDQTASRSAMELSPAPAPVAPFPAPPMSAPTPIAPPAAMIPGARLPSFDMAPAAEAEPAESDEEALTPDDILADAEAPLLPPPVVPTFGLSGPPLAAPPAMLEPPPVSGMQLIPDREQAIAETPPPPVRPRMDALPAPAEAPEEPAAGDLEVELSEEEIAPDSEKPVVPPVSALAPPPPPSVPPMGGVSPTPSPVSVIPPAPAQLPAIGTPAPGVVGRVPSGSHEIDDGAVTRQMQAVQPPQQSTEPAQERGAFPSFEVPVELSEEPVPDEETPATGAVASSDVSVPPAISAESGGREEAVPAMPVPPPPPMGIKAERSQPAIPIPPPPPLGVPGERSQPGIQLPKGAPGGPTPPPPPVGIVGKVSSQPSATLPLAPPLAAPVAVVAAVPSQPAVVVPAGATPPAPPVAPAAQTPGAPAVAATPVEAVEEIDLESPDDHKEGPKRAAPPPAPKTKRPAKEETPAPARAETTSSQRPKGRPWWEELFTDDFVRSMDRLSPSQVAKEARFIEESLALQKGGVMLDLGCGTGQHAVELASRGYSVVGYDLSLTMLAAAADEAQMRGQKLNLLQGDMREMAFEEMFDGVYSWGTSYGYFDLEKNIEVIRRVHKSLRAGGMFLLDIVNRDFIVSRLPNLAWFEGDGCVCMDDARLDSITSRLVVKRTLMLDDGRSREIEYSIRLYALHEIGRILNETGFKVVEVSGHPAMSGVFMGAESPRLITLAEKR